MHFFAAAAAAVAIAAVAIAIAIAAAVSSFSADFTASSFFLSLFCRLLICVFLLWVQTVRDAVSAASSQLHDSLSAQLAQQEQASVKTHLLVDAAAATAATAAAAPAAATGRGSTRICSDAFSLPRMWLPLAPRADGDEASSGAQDESSGGDEEEERETLSAALDDVVGILHVSEGRPGTVAEALILCSGQEAGSHKSSAYCSRVAIRSSGSGSGGGGGSCCISPAAAASMKG